MLRILPIVNCIRAMGATVDLERALFGLSVFWTVVIVASSILGGLVVIAAASVLFFKVRRDQIRSK